MTLNIVHWVRHGETDYNLNGRWQGTLDIPLNETGRRQAERVAEAFRSVPIACLYSSDLSRAYETAQRIAAPRGLEIVKDARLREIALGKFQGLTRQEIASTYPLEYVYWQNSDKYVVPNGESRLGLQARVMSFWDELLRTCVYEEVAIVTHGGTIRWMLNALAPQTILTRSIENASITTLVRDGAAWHVTRLGDISHLSV